MCDVHGQTRVACEACRLVVVVKRRYHYSCARLLRCSEAGVLYIIYRAATGGHGPDRDASGLLLQRQLGRNDLSALSLDLLYRLFLLVIDHSLLLKVFHLQFQVSSSHEVEGRDRSKRCRTQLCAQFFSNAWSDGAHAVCVAALPPFEFMLSRMLFRSRHSKNASRAS